MGTIALMLHLGRAGPLDRPNHRSLHSTPVPRAGGVGILVGMTPGLLLTTLSPGLLAGLVLVTLVSLLDDHHSLPVAVRFVSHFVAAGLVLAGGGTPGWDILGGAIILLFIIWMSNLFNFMDGANGLAGGMAAFGFGIYGVAAAMAGQSSLAVLAFCVSAAAVGFLVFNFDPARIFMGDVGSIPLGFLAAALGLDGLRLALWPPWFPILVFAPFIVDASVTLVKRGLHGDKVWLAHRDHYYQRLVRMGWSHRRLALAEYALMAAGGGSALILLHLDFEVQLMALLVWIAVYVGLMLFIDRRWANSTARHGDPA